MAYSEGMTKRRRSSHDSHLSLHKTKAKRTRSYSEAGAKEEETCKKDTGFTENALELIKTLQSHESSQARKIDLAYNFLRNRHEAFLDERENRMISENDLVPPFYFISFIQDWIQRLVINSSRSYVLCSMSDSREGAIASRSMDITFEAFVDERCWSILKWCLEFGVHLKLRLVSAGIMRPIACILHEASRRFLLEYARRKHCQSNTLASSLFPGGVCKVVVDVMQLLLYKYEQSFRPTLDSWICVTSVSLKIACEFSRNKNSFEIIGEELSPLFELVLLTCCGFDQFLKSYPNHRKKFHAVVNRLLEFLLEIISILTVEDLGKNHFNSLLNVVEDILKDCLFHPSHITGYLTVCKMTNPGSQHVEECATSEERSNLEDRIEPVNAIRSSFLSYHRLLFQQLEHFCKEQKAYLFGSLAWICRTYVVELKCQSLGSSKALLGVKYGLFEKNSSRKGDDRLKCESVDQVCNHALSSREIRAKEGAHHSLFPFFAELCFPLLDNLEDLGSLLNVTHDVSELKLHEARLLLALVNSLLIEAKQQQMYLPTQDTDNHAYLKFLKRIYKVFYTFGMSLPKFYANTCEVNKCTQEEMPILLSSLQEVILGLGHILELEYKIIENDLEDIWEVALSAAMLSSLVAEMMRGCTEPMPIIADAVICLASCMISVFSELRQVNDVIFSLCNTLKRLPNLEFSFGGSLSLTCQQRALDVLLLSPTLLAKIALSINELLEGQVPSLVKLLSKDVESTLAMLQQPCLKKCNHLRKATLKVLRQLYVCILEHLKVSSSNSVLVGLELRSLMSQHVSPSLQVILDAFVSNMRSSTRDPLMWKKGSAIEVSSLLLSLYLCIKTLHRRCVSIMPPRMARKASISIDDPMLQFTVGDFVQKELLSFKNSFFSCCGIRSVSMMDVLNAIKECAGGCKGAGALLFVLDCIAMHSLVDVSKQLKALNFVMAQATGEPIVTDIMDDFSSLNISVEEAKLKKHVKKLHRQASHITAFLLGWIHDVDCQHEEWKELLCLTWDGVVAKLDMHQGLIAKWGLLCENIGIWPEFASNRDLKSFSNFLLESISEKPKCIVNADCHVGIWSLFSFTGGLLSNELFYEQEPLLGVVLGLLCEKFEESISTLELVCASDYEPRDSEVQSCDTICTMEEKVGVLHNKARSHDKHLAPMRENMKFGKSHMGSRQINGDIQSRADYAVEVGNRTAQFQRVIHLCGFLLRIPKRCIEINRVITLMNLILTVEKSVLAELTMVGGDNLKDASIECLVACRRSLVSLLLNACEHDPGIQNIGPELSLLYGLSSMYCAPFGHTFPDNVDKLELVLQCTMGLFTFFNQNLSACLLNSLLVRTENISHPSFHNMQLDEALQHLVNMMIGHGKKCVVFTRAVKSELIMELSREPCEKRLLQETILYHLYDSLTPLAAMCSFLWSVTRTLVSLDEICHSDRDGHTKWRGQLPDDLMSFIEAAENLLMEMLQNILLLSSSQKSSDDEEKTAINKPDVGSYEDNQGGDNICLDTGTDNELAEGNSSQKVDNNMLLSSRYEGECLQEERFSLTQSLADFLEMSGEQRMLLKEILKGKWGKMACLVGEVFMGLAAVMRLRGLFHSPNLIDRGTNFLGSAWTSSIRCHVGAATGILIEASCIDGPKSYDCMILLLGVIKYVESVGSFLPYARPSLLPSAFMKLLNVQMSFLGNLISMGDVKVNEELKLAVRSALIMFLRRPLGQHFHIFLRSVEQSLFSIERINMTPGGASLDRMKQLIGVATGLECTSICLEAVSGLKRLKVLAKFSPRLVAGVLNFLNQSSEILHNRSGHFIAVLDGVMEVIVKGINCLATISSRDAIFLLKPIHIAQAIVCPAHLFKPLYQNYVDKLKAWQKVGLESEKLDYKQCGIASFSGNLVVMYQSCCKLLRNLLRHRTRESGHCMALLGESLRSLLFSLEIVSFLGHPEEPSRTLSEVECAGWLKRVYEEISEHKDILGKYSGHLLSDYVCVISGYGLTNGGLSRWIEATVRPGIYALMDVCSKDDFQLLHAVLGEGPRRAALAALRCDYEQHFKYTGKV